MTETWLCDGIYDAEFIDERYTVFRRDRNACAGGMGGGVLLAVKADLNPQSRPQWESSSEDMWISILLGDGRSVHVCCVYLPPGGGHTERVNSHMNMAEGVCAEYDDDVIVFVGDYNLPHLVWELDDERKPRIKSHTNSSVNIIFLDFLALTGVKQYNFIHNSHNKLLDLVLSNRQCLVGSPDSCWVCPDPYHPPLEITIETQKINFEVIKNSSRRVVLYNKADYSKIKNDISSHNWIEEFSSLSTDECVDRFYLILNNIIHKNIPSRVVRAGETYPCWYSSALIKVIKEKSVYHKKWKRYKNKLDYLSFSLLRNRQKRLIRECHSKYI
jgi:hypothetical protein